MIIQSILTTDPCQSCGHTPSIEFEMAPKNKCSSGRVKLHLCECCLGAMQHEVKHAQTEAVRQAMKELV